MDHTKYEYIFMSLRGVISTGNVDKDIIQSLATAN